MDDRRGRLTFCLSALGWAVLAAWSGVWALSALNGRFTPGQGWWFPPLPFIQGDFQVHIEHVARIYASGVDPYTVKGDWVCESFPYPPMVPRLFAWVALVSPETAKAVWLGVSGLILIGGGCAAALTRRSLGRSHVPAPLVVALFVTGTPALFAMERGQCDPLVIPAMFLAAVLLRRKVRWADLAAGGLLGLTAWVKYYPGLAVVALFGLRRGYGLLAFVAVAGLIGLVDREEFVHSIRNGQALAAASPRLHPLQPAKHSIVEDWKSIKVVRQTRWLRQIPAPLAAGLLIGPAVAVVALGLRRHGDDSPADLFPTLLWLVAAATFVMPYSIDYNLTPLPLAALCVWDRRDKPLTHFAMLLMLAWWQPFQFGDYAEALFFAKLAGLYAVALSLTRTPATAVAVPTAHFGVRKVGPTAGQRPPALTS